ncbi:MAG TPA: ABC transporter permease [Thermoanaerobaculia bacterium]|nr:ABC transporter permease [Thermoanaerobaculia bacterium]
MVNLALKNLLHDKLRALITISGVAFAVTLVFVQVGLFLGLLFNASVTIDRIPADLWVTSKNTANIDFAQTFPEIAIQRVRSVPGVARADNLIVWFMNVRLPSGAQEGALVYALHDFSAWGIPWRVEEGDLTDLKRGRYFFLDQSATRRWGEFEVGQYREVLGSRLKLIGRTQEAESFTTTPIVFMDYDLAQEISPFDLAGKTTYVLVRLAPGADVAAVRAEIQKRLPYNDVFTREEWRERSRSYWVDSTGLGLNMIMTVFLGCLVGVVVVAQTLYTSTMEHLKEFGTVKAIGGGNRQIYSILGQQATVASVLGFLSGAAMAFALKPAMAKISLKLLISNQLVLQVFAGTLLLCLAAALISFRKVARIDPALVFRT